MGPLYRELSPPPLPTCFKDMLLFPCSCFTQINHSKCWVKRVCVHVHTRSLSHTHTHTCVHTHMYICTHTHAHMHMDTHVYTYTCAHAHTHACTHTYAYAHTSLWNEVSSDTSFASNDPFNLQTCCCAVS